MVSDQYKGNDIVHSANDLIGVRQRIDELISNAGGMPHPGLDLYELGKKTSTGRALLQIRKSINDTLHQDPTLKEADNIFSGASNSQTAFELGNTRIIGRGDSVMEPQAAAARWSKMSAQEKSSVLEGLGRKGQNAIRDVSHNRNDGKAMADSFTTENNLSRLDALGLDSSKVRNMAAREDTLASSNNRILSGSDTARTDLARQNFPEVGKPVGSSLDSVVNVGTFGLSAVAKKGLQKVVDAYRFKKNNAAADLYSRQGGAANSLLDAIDKLNLSKKSKAQIFSRIAQQSAISGGAAQLNNSERR